METEMEKYFFFKDNQMINLSVYELSVMRINSDKRIYLEFTNNNRTSIQGFTIDQPSDSPDLLEEFGSKLANQIIRKCIRVKKDFIKRAE